MGLPGRLKIHVHFKEVSTCTTEFLTRWFGQGDRKCSWSVMRCRVLPFPGNSHLKLFCPVQCKRAVVSWVSRRSQSRVWEQMHRGVCVCVCVCARVCARVCECWVLLLTTRWLPGNLPCKWSKWCWWWSRSWVVRVYGTKRIWCNMGCLWMSLEKPGTASEMQCGGSPPCGGWEFPYFHWSTDLQKAGDPKWDPDDSFENSFSTEAFQRLACLGLTLQACSCWTERGMNSRPVFGCSNPLADASGGLGCLLTFLLPTSACCHGGQYVSVNNLAWRSLSALSLQLYWTTRLDWARLDSSRLFGLREWLLNL